MLAKFAMCKANPMRTLEYKLIEIDRFGVRCILQSLPSTGNIWTLTMFIGGLYEQPKLSSKYLIYSIIKTVWGNAYHKTR